MICGWYGQTHEAQSLQLPTSCPEVYPVSYRVQGSITDDRLWSGEGAGDGGVSSRLAPAANLFCDRLSDSLRVVLASAALKLVIVCT